MDRVISDEERIRRAEEIAARRRNKIPVGNFNNRPNEKYRISKFGKFFLQTITSICLFGILYFLNHNYSYAFEKIRPVMDNDTDFNQIYGYVNNAFYDIVDNNGIKGNSNDNTDNSNDGNESDETKSKTIENESEATSDKKINISEASTKADSNENTDNSDEKQSNDESLDDVSYIKKYANVIKPVNGTVTSGYGERQATDIVSAYHKGVDIGASIGTPIYSCMEGQVTDVANYGDYGKHLKITNGEISMLYAHCSKIDVNVGDKITQGQKIAEVGSTGRSTGPHLHIEIMRSGRNVDPSQIIQF